MAATAERIKSYEDFVKVHGLLLTASGLPPSLQLKLFEKLSSETFDGGSFFQIEPCEEGPQRRLILTSESMAKDSNVFLIDHAWTFRLSDAYKQVLPSFFSFLITCLVDGKVKRKKILRKSRLNCIVISFVLKLVEVPGLDERMAAIMCVDNDLNFDSEDNEVNNGKQSVLEVIESELGAAKEKGEGPVRWLELEELDIDDDTMLSLDLANKFPVISLSLT